MNGTKGKNGGAVGSPRAETARILLSIDRPKSYCSAGRMFAPMPALEVRGAGALSFPVPKDQAGNLSDRSASRPGETARNGAEIGPEDARLGGGGWEKTLAGVLDAAAEGIGCPRKDLEARFKKLSALGPGESLRVGDRKAEETAAVLIVALPVSGGAEGGEIVVRHKDEETVLDIRVREPSEIAWAAFYADCRQKTLPVTAGRALALVFNLELSGGPNGRGRAPDYGEETERMARALAAWSARAEEGEKMVVLLNHDCGGRGFSPGELRGVDAAVGEVLLEAAAAAGCAIYLGVADICESAELEYDGYAPDESAFSAENLVDWRGDLDYLAAPDGSRAEFESASFKKNDILPADSLSRFEPYEEGQEEDWIGLYDRKYILAAISIWPRRACSSK